MKAIKVTADNADAIKAALAAVNGRSHAHTYTSCEEVIWVTRRAETRLEELGLPKGLRSGARMVDQSGTKLPRAYGNRATTTTITVERRSSAWWLVEVRPSILWPQARPYQGLVLTPAQDAEAVRRLRETYRVDTPSPAVALVA